MSDARLVKLLSAKVEKLEAELAAANARAEKAEMGDHSENEHIPTWRELTEYWKQRAEKAEADLAAARELLNDLRTFVIYKAKGDFHTINGMVDRIDAALKDEGRT